MINMPGQDQTGPMGAGPMTGRGMGPCGGGFGRGRGCGFGYGRRGGYYLTGEERKASLEREVEYLKEDLKDAEKELKSLEN